jgi:serine/threonine protein kinase
VSSLSKMLFTIANRVFYETLDHYAVNKQAFLEPVRLLLPADWKIDRNGMWFNVTPPAAALPVQGWKIHVSATQANAPELLQRIVPMLVGAQRAFKFALDPLVLSIINGKGWSVAGAGKFVTIYFDNEEQFVLLAEQLHHATVGLEGPFVLSDRRYKGSKIIHYRYGGISPMEVLTEKGERLLVLSSPDGRTIPDERLSRFVLPDWVQDPFPGPHATSPGEQPTTLKDGRYTVRLPLAISSCGGVYLATDNVSGAAVVIKQARPLLNFTPSGVDAVGLLEREYRLLKKIENTGIAPRPLDFFKEEEPSYLVEEFIPNAIPLRFYSGTRTVVALANPDLKKVEAFWEEYKRIFLQIARLLETLHQHGIVFMDFSHNNVLIGNDGKDLKLIDLEGAFEAGVDAPSHLLTPGFTSVSDLNVAPGFANDYYAFGAAMLSYIIPINAIILLDPQAPARFLQSITEDFGLPQELERLITRLLDPKAALRPSLAEAITVLESLEISSTPHSHVPNDLEQACAETVKSTVQHILAVATYDRADRLFPSDPKVFVTNPLNVAFGACGVALAIKTITGDVPPGIVEWILKQKIHSKSYPPGLYLGTAGIAWVLKSLGIDQKAEELMRSTWNHPALKESPDMFYGLAGWGIAQLKFFLDTKNQEYLEQAIRAGEYLAASAKQENGNCYWPQTNGSITLGFAHGSSGISIFLLYLYIVTGNEKFLNIGKSALNFDLAAAVPNIEGALSWQVRRAPGAPSVPYIRYGSSGVGLALVRYYRALGDPRYLEVLEQMFPDTTRKYGIYPGRFIGLAGIGEFLLALREIEPFHSRCSEALRRLISGILLFQVNTAKGVAFPGYELYRFSCDFATGSAGIAFFLHRYLNQSSDVFSLDDILMGPVRSVS